MNKERYEKISQELYGMNLKEYINYNKSLDKKAAYFATKYIALARLLNDSCSNMNENTEERFFSKIYANITFKVDKIEENRRNKKRQYVSGK